MQIAGDVVRVGGLTARMDDGTALVADAWRPAEGRWPVLLQRLPYGRSVASTPVLPHPEWFARRGYAVVVQDCRGRGGSGGTFRPFLDEGADGAQSIEWAAALPFCDGRVATYGFSYQGLGQLYAAALRPPSLHAIAPMMCCPDPYEGWTYEDGLLRWPFVCFWAAQLAGQEQGVGPIPFDVRAVPLDRALGDDPPSWFTEWLAHPHDDDYWAARRPDLDAIDVPAFTVLGWFDDFSSGTARLIERLGAEAWCGPWAHMPWGTRHSGVDLGATASPAPVYEALVAFFDRVFGREVRAPNEHVRYLAIGDRWRGSAQWPPASDERVVLHGVTATGNANSRWGDGRLIRELPDGDAPACVLVDEPLVPVPGDALAFQEESAVHDRRDVACFTSAPFDSLVVVVGEPVVEVRSEADVTGHDLVATLCIVNEDGTARIVTAAGAHGTGAWRLTLRPIAVALAPGQRLRLTLAGSRFPCYPRRSGPVATIRIVSASLMFDCEPR